MDKHATDLETNTITAEAPIKIVFVLGLPGAGKGTLCKRLATQLGWYHISVGDHLRELSTSEEAVKDAAFGNLSLSELRTHLQERKLLPADTVAAVIAHKIEKERCQGHCRFLIDGFPRNVETAKAFERELARPAAVLLFDCLKDVAKRRFIDRKRGDDDGGVFEKRYEEYGKLNGEILARYAPIIKRLDTSGSEEETYDELREIATGVMGPSS